MFDRLLIANRGEIACRIIKTARQMGIRTIAVHSDVDAKALHVRMADEAVSLGGAAPSESYLRAGRILALAKEAKADAIHPGYGFLSENADFAQMTADAGMVFVGPPAHAIREMGSKDRAKEIMTEAGVPGRAWLSRLQSGRGVSQAQGLRDRLSGSYQGRRRWRGQGHAARRQGARFRCRARGRPPRGRQFIRQR